MTYLKTLLLFLCLAFLLSEANGQISPPTFQCVRSDSLFWAPATNSCGSFVSTRVYFSATPSGPFSLLDSITDETITAYHHPLGGGNAYYYLEANFDCAGQTRIPSDTLNNLPPASTTLEKVTVQGDDILVTWYDNNDTKTVGYIVYKSTAQGTMPVDTIFSGFEYLDKDVDVQNRSESYYVLAIDQCGNTGLFDMPHNTVLMRSEMNFCEQYLRLSWNPYGIWQNGTENVQLWLGLDGAPLEYEDQVQVQDTQNYITGIGDNREYCMEIRYKEKGRDVVSVSNRICLISDVITPITKLEIRNLSVNPDGSVEILYSHNVDADLQELTMSRGSEPASIESFENITAERPSMDDGQYGDRSATTSQRVYYYQINTIDDCDELTESTYFATVLLNSQTSQAGRSELSWTAFEAPGRSAINQILCRIESDGTETVIYNGLSSTQFADEFTQSIPGPVCYLLKTIHTNLAGVDTLVSRSNLSCTEQMINIYVPNAFAPQGVNSIFQPEPSNGASLPPYSLQVFDRWGGKLFEGQDFGWNGRQDGQLLNPGVYFYIIKYSQPDGTTEQKSGSVTILN